jgi:hypothetical protein
VSPLPTNIVPVRHGIVDGLPVVQGNDARVHVDLLYKTPVADTAVCLRLRVLRIAQNPFTPLAFEIASLPTQYDSTLTMSLVVFAGAVRRVLPLEPLDQFVQSVRYGHLRLPSLSQRSLPYSAACVVSPHRIGDTLLDWYAEDLVSGTLLSPGHQTIVVYGGEPGSSRSF